MKITLTPDQETAITAINKFILSPAEKVFVLQGYSGTGKSTVVRHLLERLPTFMKTAKLIRPDLRELEIMLTATTNKAAESLQQITDKEVSTIHAFMGFRVVNDFKANTSKLIVTNRSLIEDALIFIDEASYIDTDLLEKIFSKLGDSKVIFIGDPAQLVPIKATSAPVFKAGFPGAMLSQVVRQAEGNPIETLSTQFRETVNSGKFFQFVPDGKHISYLSRQDFMQAAIDDCSRPDWKYSDSKILTWTNKAAINANNLVRSSVQGIPHFAEGEYAVCNAYISPYKGVNIKTDQMVRITGISADITKYGVVGNDFTLDGRFDVFMPKTLDSRNERLKRARKEGNFDIIRDIETTWIDLRAAYAQTVNKSQGSTYEQVFVDLDDIGKCNSGNQIARMLYVAISRAKTNVYLTGDFC